MYFPSLFTRHTTLNISAATALLGGLLWVSSVGGQAPTSESGEAAITDPNQECIPYSYPPVVAQLSNFPLIWTPATLLPNDTEGQAKWQSIQASIPTDIPVKGTLAGDFSNFTPTYSPTDPDCWWPAKKCVQPKLSGLPPDIVTMPEPMSLGYGFDDGPNCSHNAFYDFLSQQNQTATMFHIGSNVMDWPYQAQRALADGHQICVHTWSHRYMTAFQSQDAFAELWYALKAIKLVTGVTPKCWRPPYGDVDDRIRAIANTLDLQTVIWMYDSNDWQVGAPNSTVTPQQVDSNYESLIESAQNGTFNQQGTIMLMHELTNYTMQETMNFYFKLKSVFHGGMFPIAVGLNETQPYVETNYTVPSYSQYMQGIIKTSSTPSAKGASTGGAIGMPVSSGGLVGVVTVIVAFWGGIIRVLV